MINKIEGSLTMVQHRSVKKTYTDNADSAATLAWKAPNFPRKKKKTIHLNEQQIRALPGMQEPKRIIRIIIYYFILKF